ncbi:acyl-CoA N-acyltransferase [Abortiporus biennis]|nr:acyl-CoA N-acyltransferase [Abortiporus biennis]
MHADNSLLRLKAIQNALSPPLKDSAYPPWKKVLILPDDATVDVLFPNPPEAQSIQIAINRKVVCAYRILARSARLVVSGVGTPHEDKSDHIPQFPVLEILPASAVDPSGNQSISIEDAWGVLNALHTIYHTQEVIPIVVSSSLANGEEITKYLLESGLARKKHVLKGVSPDPELFLLRISFWQGAGTGGYHERGWLRGKTDLLARAPFPWIPSFTRTPLVIAAHPLRPSKPQPGELVYRKYLPMVHQFLEFHYMDIEEKDGPTKGRHLAAFHKWQNNPIVNKGWGEAGPLEKHIQYVKELHAKPSVLPLIMSWDGELMGYTELTYIKEDHVAPHVPYGVGDYDRGLHILVGEEKFRGNARSQGWMSGIMHYLFLADPRTDRIIGEPKESNPAVLKLSLDIGMNIEFDFPYKRSVITRLSRDRFFKYDIPSHVQPL